MNFKKQLFFGAIALLTVGLTGCANNTSSNSSNNQATSSKSSKTNQSSTIMMVQKMILVIGITKVTINSQLR